MLSTRATALCSLFSPHVRSPKVRSLRLAFLFLSVIGLLFVNTVLADTFESADTSSPDEKPQATSGSEKPVSKAYNAFAQYKSDFKQLCEAIAEDGRRDALFLILQPYDVRDDKCVSCRPLFSTFMTACRPPLTKSVLKKPKPKATPTSDDSEEPTATPTPKPLKLIKLEGKQREPSLTVAARTTELFRDLVQNGKELDEIGKAVKKLIQVLAEPSGKTPGEKDYYSALAALISTPFGGDLDAFIKRKMAEKENSQPADDF